MPRLKLTLAYVGTHYRGWQIQAWKDRPHPPTVQAELEKAVSYVAGVPTHVQGAGRTDSGVHADGQVAHCDVPEAKAGLDWQRALNTRLPRDIRVMVDQDQNKRKVVLALKMLKSHQSHP